MNSPAARRRYPHAAQACKRFDRAKSEPARRAIAPRESEKQGARADREMQERRARLPGHERARWPDRLIRLSCIRRRADGPGNRDSPAHSAPLGGLQLELRLGLAGRTRTHWHDRTRFDPELTETRI